MSGNNADSSLLSPAALLSPDVLTCQKQRRLHAAKNRRLVLHRVGECLYRSEAGIYYAIQKVNGKQFRKSLQTDNKEVARRRLSELRRLRCRQNPAAAMTFDELTTQWLEFLKIRGMKPMSYRRRVVAVRSISGFLGLHSIRKLTRLHLERWAARRTQNCSPRTYNIELETMKQILNYAVEHALILESPAAALKRRRQKAAPVIIPSREQFKALIADLRLGQQSKDAADFIEFLAYSCPLQQGRTSPSLFPTKHGTFPKTQP